jgi:hypothetical protein
MKRIILLFGCFILSKTVLAQSDTCVNFYFGTIHGLRSFTSMKYRINGPTVGLQFGWTNPVNMDNKDIIKGISTEFEYHILKVLYVGNGDQIYGNRFSLSKGLKFKIARSEWGNVDVTPKMGIAYNTSTFYNTANQNTIIGSHINILSQVQLNIHWGIAQVGIGVSHESNSNTVAPNPGFNQVFATLMVNSDDGYRAEDKQLREIKPKHFNLQLLIGEAGTVRTGYYVHDGKGIYPDTAIQRHTGGIVKYAISASYLTPLINHLDIGAGVDGVYSKTVDNNHFFQTYTGNYASITPFHAGANVQLAFNFGRVSVVGASGYYVAGQLSVSRFYNTINFNYYITPHLALSAKSYLSDFGSAGISFTL